MRLASIVRFGVPFVVALTIAFSAVPSQAQSRLFSAASAGDVSAAQSQRLQVIQSEPATSAVQVFSADTAALTDNAVEIPLVNNGTVVAQHTKTNDRRAGDYSWFGSLPGGGDVILVVRDGEITGQISNGTEVYRVTPLGGSLHAIVKLDQSQFKPELPPLKIPGNTQISPNAMPDLAAPLANTTYDVLVAYTPAAAAAAGGTSAMASLIQLSIDVTNQTYANSQIAVTANLVGTLATTYTETTGCGSDAFTCALNSLTAGSGALAPVTTKRDQLGADEVVLLISDNAFCGLAWLLSDAAHGFAVVDQGCAAGNLSFPHEIGHNFGADHDAANAGTSPTGFTDNRGYCDGGHNWRTVMAYPSPCGGTRVKYFSNPNVIYPGSPSGAMGVNGASNNARVHTVRASTIAGFRQSAASSPALVSSVLPTSRSTQVPTAATAFATVINAGGGAGTNCGLSLGTGIAGVLAYQTTNPSTNQPTGSPNTPVSIAAGSSQSFVFSVTPNAAYGPIDTAISATCSNAGAPGVIPGVNTILLSASNSAVPDIIALAASTDPGYVDIPGANGAGAFSVATSNVGATGAITVTADTGSAALPVSIKLCQTNSSATCVNPAFPGASSVSLTINAGQTPTFSVFVTGSGTVANDPATNRVFVRFKDGGGTTRGSTSVAVRTQ